MQRVSSARIEVDGQCVGAMGEGLLALVGAARRDTPRDAAELARKLTGLRVFVGEAGRMDRSLLETGGTLGVVSQFSLLAETRKGRRPSFSEAAKPEQAEPLLERLVEDVRAAGVEVVCGRFGARMRVQLVNEGPTTLLVDTRPVA